MSNRDFFSWVSRNAQRVLQSVFPVTPVLERRQASVVPTTLEIEHQNGRGAGWVWSDSHDRRDDFEFIAYMLQATLARFPIDLAQIVTTGHSRGEPEKCASTDFDMYYRLGYGNRGTPFATPGSDWSDPGFLGAVEATLRFRACASFQQDQVF